MDKYKIAETEHYSEKIQSKKYHHLYHKICETVYPMLRQNPFFGSNIKKLKGEYKDIYRFRIGTYRLFYKIEKQQAIIFIIDIVPRKDAH